MMRRFIAAIILVLFMPLVNHADEQSPELGIMLTPERAGLLKLDKLKPVIAVNNRGNVVLGTGNNIFSLNTGQFLLKTPAQISDCAFTVDGALLIISGNFLGYCAGGNFFPHVNLPETGMHMAVGLKSIYVFGGDNDKATSIYVIEPGRGHAKLCDMPFPVGCAVVTGNTLFFTVSGDIYRLKPGGELNLVCRMPGPAITSIAAGSNEKLYFTSGLTLYLWQNGMVALIGEGLGEKIFWQNDALYILNSEKKSLIRLRDTGSVIKEN